MDSPVPPEYSPLTRDNLHEELSAEELAWGQNAVILQTTANQRMQWLKSQMPRQALQLYAAAFRVARS